MINPRPLAWFVASALVAPAACVPETGGEGEGEGEGEDVVGTIVSFDASGPKDVSSDGSVALVERLGFGDVLVVDTRTGDVTAQTTFPEPFRNQAGGLSDHGDIAADYDLPVQAGRFHDGTWTALGSLFDDGCTDGEGVLTDVAGAFDIDSSGDVVVGFAWDACAPVAYRWDNNGDGGVMTALAVLGEGFNGAPPTNRATVISDDGRIAGGFAENTPLDRSAAIWTEDGAGFLLAPDDRENPSEVLAINADGTVATGVRSNEAFRWSADTGIVNLGRLEGSLPGLDNIFANAVTADGEVVFGTCGVDAFVWTEAAGMRKVSDVLASVDLAFDDNIVFNNVIAVSQDGSVVVGSTTNVDNNAAGTAFVHVPPSVWR